MRPQHVRITRDPTVVIDVFSRETLRIPAQTLYCQKLESLNYIKAAIIWISLHLILRNCFRNPRNDVQVFFLQNPANIRTNLILPESRLPTVKVRPIQGCA